MDETYAVTDFEPIPSVPEMMARFIIVEEGDDTGAPAGTYLETNLEFSCFKESAHFYGVIQDYITSILARFPASPISNLTASEQAVSATPGEALDGTVLFDIRPVLPSAIAYFYAQKKGDCDQQVSEICLN